MVRSILENSIYFRTFLITRVYSKSFTNFEIVKKEENGIIIRTNLQSLTQDSEVAATVSTAYD